MMCGYYNNPDRDLDMAATHRMLKMSNSMAKAKKCGYKRKSKVKNYWKKAIFSCKFKVYLVFVCFLILIYFQKASAPAKTRKTRKTKRGRKK